MSAARPRPIDGKTYVVGQMYVEMRIPPKQTHPYPIVMVHGGTRSGTNFTGTPDGREGWAQYFVRHGYAVYVVDQPGRGRSGYLAEAYGRAAASPTRESAQRRYLQQEKSKLWPQAHLHTQWPGNGEPDDPATLQIVGSFLPEIETSTSSSLLNRDALIALVDKIGPVDPADAFAGRRVRLAGRGCAARSGEGDRRRSSRTGRPATASNSSARRTGSRRAASRCPTASPRCRSPMRRR